MRPTQAAAQDAPPTDSDPDGTSEADPVRASLNVDAGAVGEAGSVLESRIRAQVDQLRLKEEVLPGEDGDPIVTVVVRSLPGDAIGYEVEVSVQHRGQVISDTFRSEQCKLCTEGEVVDLAENMVADLVPRLRELVAGDDPSTEPVAPVDKKPSAAEEINKQPKPSSSPSGDKKRRPLQPMGKAGVALIVIGAAGLGTGVGLALADGTRSGDMAYQEINTMEAGYATVAVGGAVFITGIVLLGVDRKRARDKTAWVVPQIGPRGGGLAWVGRF